jgi:hypothetical protein
VPLEEIEMDVGFAVREPAGRILDIGDRNMNERRPPQVVLFEGN